MKRDSAVFRLKSCHKNLDTSDYAANLCAYLDHSRGATKLSMGDLRNVLNGLNTLSGPTEAIDTAIEDKLSPSDSASNTQESSYAYGEHVACVWCDDVGNGINWHLGVVDKVDGDTVAVSYMKRTDKKGLNWLFPSEAAVFPTKPDQIIARRIPVRYTLTAVMRCVLDEETHNDIDQCFQSMV